MKRSSLLKELREAGCLFHRHGKRHDLWINPANGRKAPVPRHTELKDSLCELIRNELGVKA